MKCVSNELKSNIIYQVVNSSDNQVKNSENVQSQFLYSDPRKQFICSEAGNISFPQNLILYI